MEKQVSIDTRFEASASKESSCRGKVHTYFVSDSHEIPPDDVRSASLICSGECPALACTHRGNSSPISRFGIARQDLAMSQLPLHICARAFTTTGVPLFLFSAPIITLPSPQTES
jgi:hypothetical protein